jgi:hypothetical protein
MEIWEPKAPGTLWATPGLLREPFNFTFYRHKTGALAVDVGSLRLTANILGPSQWS